MINKYVFAALSIAVAIGPARALDAGLGGKAGGIGVGADAGVGRQGASLGGGAKADGVGGANLGGSVGTGNGAPSASVGAGGNVDGVGGANLGGSVGTGNAAPSASDGGSSGVAGGSAGGSSGGLSAGSGPSAASSTGRGAGSVNGTSGGIARNTNVALPGALMPHARIVLPRSLGPSDRSTSASARRSWGYPMLPKIAQKPGTSDAVVGACRQAIFAAARPLGAVGVQAASAGPVHRQPNGITARLSVRIDYGKEVRQAQISCRLDAKGKVITVT